LVLTPALPSPHHHSFPTRRSSDLDLITWKQMQVADLSIKTNNGYLIGNPPYGERIKDKDYVRHVYNQLGEKMRPHESWSVYIMTSFKEFEKVYGEKAT